MCDLYLLTRCLSFQARDARHFESQTDRVKTFTSAVLTDPVEWTGAVHAVIAARVGAPDCDIIVRVSDVIIGGHYHRFLTSAQRDFKGRFPDLRDCRRRFFPTLQVYPDGRSILIADKHRRASFRNGLNLPPAPPLAVGET
jgi:predicted acyl esterase